MWGGPTPHNLVILCLCYANQTSSEVPISSSNRDTARLGRGDRILLPSVIPAQVQGRHNTTRSTLTIGYPLRIQRRQTRRRITPGIPPFLAVASVDRTQQGIWGWPVQSPRHPQVLILSQKPRRKQKKRATTVTMSPFKVSMTAHKLETGKCPNNMLKKLRSERISPTTGRVCGNSTLSWQRSSSLVLCYPWKPVTK